LKYLILTLKRQIASLEALEAAFDRLDELRRGPELDLTGWVMTPDSLKGVRWSSTFRGPLFDDDEHDIGSGGPKLRKVLEPPKIRMSTTTGHDVVPMKAINGFVQARGEEMLREDWPQSWGKAYDLIVYQDEFRWLDKLTYVRWDLTLDSDVRISSLTQGDVVFTQERVRSSGPVRPGCTLMFTKRVGDIRPKTELSVPIYRGGMDLDWYFNQPYTVTAPYYACYVRVKTPRESTTMLTALRSATEKALMRHVGADEMDPRFEMNRPLLEEMARETLEQARRA
jgi:hypothetical protein